MFRSLLYGVRSGLAEIRRMSVLVSVTVFVVALATVLALMSSGLNELTEVGSAAITVDAEVIVFLSTDLTDDEVARAETDLATLPGVDRVHPATSADIASTRGGHEVGSDISNVRSLFLNGSVPQSEIVLAARHVKGADKVEAGVGERAEWTASLLQMILPWLAALFAIAGFGLITSLTFAAARTRRDEATIMRLLGANWAHVIASVGTVVVVPVVATILVVTVIVSITWTSLLRAVAPESVGTVPPSSVFSTGIALAVVMGLVTTGLIQLGTMRVHRQNEPEEKTE